MPGCMAYSVCQASPHKLHARPHPTGIGVTSSPRPPGHGSGGPHSPARQRAPRRVSPNETIGGRPRKQWPSFPGPTAAALTARTPNRYLRWYLELYPKMFRANFNGIPNGIPKYRGWYPKWYPKWYPNWYPKWYPNWYPKWYPKI